MKQTKLQHFQLLYQYFNRLGSNQKRDQEQKMNRNMRTMHLGVLKVIQGNIQGLYVIDSFLPNRGKQQ